MFWPGMRLFAAFKTESCDSLTLEGPIFELLGCDH